jgi:hypothetical protein
MYTRTFRCELRQILVQNAEKGVWGFVPGAEGLN